MKGFVGCVLVLGCALLPPAGRGAAVLVLLAFGAWVGALLARRFWFRGGRVAWWLWGLAAVAGVVEGVLAGCALWGGVSRPDPPLVVVAALGGALGFVAAARGW